MNNYTCYIRITINPFILIYFKWKKCICFDFFRLKRFKCFSDKISSHLNKRPPTLSGKHIYFNYFLVVESLSQWKNNLTKAPIFHSTVHNLPLSCQNLPPICAIQASLSFLSHFADLSHSLRRASCPYKFSEGRVSAETVDEKLSTLNWCQKKAGQ